MKFGGLFGGRHHVDILGIDGRHTWGFYEIGPHHFFLAPFNKWKVHNNV
jgi:hypothetical protein